MTQKQLHPNVLKFKEFAMRYPKMSLEVRKGTVTWQELYEDWYLLGEDDPRWEVFMDENRNDHNKTEPIKEENKSDFMTTILDYLKTMDGNQIQQHISHLSQALGAVQGVLSQFQPPSQQPSSRNNSGPSHPFSFRKD